MAGQQLAKVKAPRFCVFCGAPPTKKNREHILPRWLIQMTGAPGRKILIGKIAGKELYFSFDSFTAPSCTSCNDAHSDLEAAAKRILTLLLNEGAVTQDDWNTLLDWFDKVRVGLWLYYLYLTKNKLGIDPTFHIASRIRQKDRCLFIYATDKKSKAVRFWGINTPGFEIHPSCFVLEINGLIFLNISDQDIISPRMGFPFAKSLTQYKDREEITPDVGSARIKPPLLGIDILEPAIEIYQPIVHNRLMAMLPGLKDRPHLVANCIDSAKGLGRIFTRIGRSSISAPPTTDLGAVFRIRRTHTWDLTRQIHIQIFRLQEWLITRNKHFWVADLTSRKILKKLEKTVITFCRAAIRHTESDNFDPRPSAIKKRDKFYSALGQTRTSRIK